MSRLLKKRGTFLLSTDIEHSPTKTEPLSLKKDDLLIWLREAHLNISLIKIDDKTYNFKKGKRIIIKGVKDD
jgi:hypothetical protein